MRDTLPVAGDNVGVSARSQRGQWTRLAALIAGDAASFTVFAAVGLRSHHEAASLATIVGTAIPFAAGWFLVAPFLGAFRRSVTTGVQAMLKRTEIAWLTVWPVAALLRWAFGPDHKLPISFAIVILIANAVFLGVWRSIFALLAGRRSA